MFPSPLNPFAVDHRYFDSLPLAERIIATGAMANLLQEILANGNHPYNARGRVLYHVENYTAELVNASFQLP
jgi:hypothetical protein